MQKLVSGVLPIVVIAMLASGCSTIRAQVDGSTRDDGASITLPPVLETAEWAVNDGLLSVLVRNDDSRQLRNATVTLQGLDADGVLVGTWNADTMAGESSCCTVLDLEPDGQFGLYFAIGADAEQIDDIRLSFTEISWAERGGAPVEPAAVAVPQDTFLDTDRTVVTARVVTGPQEVPRALVQAVLRGRSGKLIAVVSGRWSCFAADETRRIRMELFQQVPAGTTVDTVTVTRLNSGPQPTC
ncbi:hypothetical protein I601_3818 [Nocardioides dokdonensis FR1436]|uniref:Uncharacterized protein n=1 Tax=Nocardioides dokdonensis FR1436 TaxID=1300347 RepID=A0A1A9GPG1_9ACTN|nr:hypothetical protein [Nocardioides dokdonensis]ANH40217.1 hypothetical protein I601_3818 [Nocardioides dokdonensis FR1436]